MYERVVTHFKRRLNKHTHVSYQNITAKRRIIFAEKDHLLNYILKHYGVNSGFMRKKVMNPSFPGHAPPQRHLESRERGDRKGVNGGENRGIHGRDPCRLTWAISGDFRLVVLGILLYSCVLRTKTRSKIAPWQVQRSFDRRICAKAMKSPQTIRRYWQGL